MTDAQRLEWACWVLDQHRHRGQAWLAVMRCGMPWAVSGGDDVLYPDEAIAIALALDEQARRKLPMSEQAEWAAAELASRVSSCAPCRAASAQGSWFCSDKFGRVRWAKEAIAIAESLVRREMLGDTSDANAKGVKP